MKKMYRPQDIESKWQTKWETDKVYQFDCNSAKKKYYCLDMFPYPSAAGLHVGHVEGYTATDVLSRYMRARGYNVLHPMGWDAFGLPAENYAIKQKVHPHITTQKSIEEYKSQLKKLGTSYDWSRELDTSNSNYYKWTQWLFLLMYHNGLAYRKEAPVNWCRSCQTVLANEQVVKKEDKNVCERCDTEVVQKDLKQWFFKITEYAERLLTGLEDVDWPQSAKQGQRNWIGKQEGINIKWKVEGSETIIETFTKYPETIFGASFITIAPEHKFVSLLTTKENQKDVESYVRDARKKTQLQRTELAKTKTGVFTGSYVLNPLSGEKIPVWVSDYVLATYGTGAVFGAPAHDLRDFHFAKKYGLKIIRVIKSKDGDSSVVDDEKKIVEDGTIINSDFLNGLDAQAQAKTKIMIYLEEKGFGKKVVFYHLRDWLISRQRYWGAPTPIVYCESCARDASKDVCCEDGCTGDCSGGECACSKDSATGDNKQSCSDCADRKCSCSDEKCGDDDCACSDGCGCSSGLETTEIDGKKYAVIPVPEDQLPVLLPNDVDFLPTGESPLVRSKAFNKVVCPRCGAKEGVIREYDTLDTFVDSSWYFFRFCDPKNTKEFASSKEINKICPIDLYIGGEHVTTHLLFSRFFTKVLYDCGLISFEEPFLKLRLVGFILGEDGRKMSKRWGNVINPDEVIKAYGADTLRTYEMFMGPIEVMKPWSTKSVEGVKRFYNKVWELSNYCIEEKVAKSGTESLHQVHKLIKKVTEDVEAMKFNTAIAFMMEFINYWGKNKDSVGMDALKAFIVLVAPFGPHISEEIWQLMGEKYSVTKASWPEYQKEYLKEDLVEIAVQVNGKVRCRVVINGEELSDEKAVKEKVLSAEKIRVIVGSKKIKNFVYIKGRLVSLVVE